MGTAQNTPSQEARKPHGISYYFSYLRSLLFTNLLI
jgi:hypothetical protein